MARGTVARQDPRVQAKKEKGPDKKGAGCCGRLHPGQTVGGWPLQSEGLALAERVVDLLEKFYKLEEAKLQIELDLLTARKMEQDAVAGKLMEAMEKATIYRATDGKVGS